MPRDFWNLTPRELSLQAEGAKVRQKRDYERIAWLACLLINSQRKKGSRMLKPDDLLKPSKRKVRRLDDPKT